MSDYKLKKDEKIDIEAILDGLESYVPKKRPWTWRKPVPDLEMNGFHYQDMSEPLKESVPLPSAKYFGNIDPQGCWTITTEIASGRFEDDIRRMRMAAHHGADHIMVIRTAGQSHFDGLIEGTPQGMGGVPITRKQVRAQRRALDLIEEEVGRPINYHSYVSGVAGPDIAVMFCEEGVAGAHQDPQYNVIYRNINMIRSFVDACESKRIMAAFCRLTARTTPTPPRARRGRSCPSSWSSTPSTPAFRAPSALKKRISPCRRCRRQPRRPPVCTSTCPMPSRCASSFQSTRCARR